MTENEENGTTKAVALFHGQAEKVHALARYGESRAVRIVSDRIQATDKGKGKNKLMKGEALLVAQAAVATGLSPFQPQPELWYWVQVARDGRRFLTIMRGRDGTIRLAQEAAQRAGTYLKAPRYRDIVDDSERKRWAIPDGALAIEATVEDYQSSATWWKKFHALKEAGYSPDQIDQRIGEGPAVDAGIGILTATEIKDFDKSRNAMPHINRVRKRAYVEALKARWAPQINIQALSDGRSPDDEDYIIEGEWMDAEVTEGEIKELSDEELREQADEASEDLYGEPISPPANARPYSPEKVKSRVTDRSGKTHKGKRASDKQLGLAMGCLNLCFAGDDASDQKRHSVLAYLFAVNSGKDLKGPQTLALLDWLEPKEDSGGAYKPNKYAVIEAKAIVNERMEELGQEILPIEEA